MPHVLLICDLAPDYLERRGETVKPHIAHVWGAMERGDMILGGVIGDPLESAMFLFRDTATAQAFAAADPYTVAGLYTGHRTMPWVTVPNGEGESVIPA